MSGRGVHESSSGIMLWSLCVFFSFLPHTALNASLLFIWHVFLNLYPFHSCCIVLRMHAAEIVCVFPHNRLIGLTSCRNVNE